MTKNKYSSLTGNPWIQTAASPARWGFIVLISLVSFLGIDATRADSTNLLTFDNLPSGVSVPAGYGGLQWNGFAAVSSTSFALLIPPYPPGFVNGLVSKSNVVYNTSFLSVISNSSGSFDLDSAYLTAALTNTDVEVLGYMGTNLIYDQAYSLTPFAPSFISFNYNGVNEVILSGGEFVMDNLSVALNPPCGSLEFSSPTYAVTAGNSATILVNRVGGATGEIAVQVTTSDGTGSNGVNYIGFTNTLTWGNGEISTKSIALATLQNGMNGSKTVNLSLSDPSGNAALSSPSNAVVTIQGTNSCGGTSIMLPIEKMTLVTGVCLRLQSANATSGGNCLLQYATNLAAPITWTPLTTNQADTNGICTFLVTNSLSEPARFFRVVPIQ